MGPAGGLGMFNHLEWMRFLFAKWDLTHLIDLDQLGMK